MRTAVIVIPTYNEANNINILLKKIYEVQKDLSKWELKVLIVDSNSPDSTSSIVKKLQKENNKIFLINTKKEGLGKAYTTGFKYALEKLDPYVLFEMDADLSHDPNKIPEFLSEIEKGADFVVGTRYSKGGSIPKDWAFHRKLFSVVGNLVIRVGFAKFKISDWTSGYRAIKSWVVKTYVDKAYKHSGYVFQVATLDLAIKNNARIEEIPIHFTDRREGVSKINSFQFIVQTLFYVFNNSSFIKYCIVGASSAVIDFGLSFIFIEVISMSVLISTLLSVESSIIFNFLSNNFWSFSHKKIEGKNNSILKTFIKFNLIQALPLFIQFFGIGILVNLYGQKYWYVYKIFIIVFLVIPITYFLYNNVIWKNKKRNSNFN